MQECKILFGFIDFDNKGFITKEWLSEFLKYLKENHYLDSQVTIEGQ